MALNLTEAAKLSTDTLAKGVLETFVQVSPILDRIPLMNIDGNVYAYNEEAALPGVAFRGVNESYAESTGTFNQKSEKLVILGGDADVDRFIQQTRSNVNDQRAEQTTLKVKAISYKFQETFFNGDSSVDAKSFDGLKKRLTGKQVIDAAENGMPILGDSNADIHKFFDKLDELLGAVPGINPTNGAIYASSAIIRKIASAMRHISYDTTLQQDIGGKGAGMTLNLITGKSGTQHVTSGDMGAVQAALVGNASYLLQDADGAFPAVSMQSANKALVPTLNLILEGRYARVAEEEAVTIESGRTGVNRNDLVCVKYERDSNNIESVTLAVLKGTASSGTATDPTVPEGSILDGAATVWIPIARVPISGVNAGTPVMLIRQMPPISQLWDSVTHSCKLKFQDTKSFVESAYSGGNEIIVRDGLIFVDLASFKSTVTVSTGYQVWLLSSGVRPSERIIIGGVANVAGKSGGKQVTWNTDGSLTLNMLHTR